MHSKSTAACAGEIRSFVSHIYGVQQHPGNLFAPNGGNGAFTLGQGPIFRALSARSGVFSVLLDIGEAGVEALSTDELGQNDKMLTSGMSTQRD